VLDVILPLVEWLFLEFVVGIFALVIWLAVSLFLIVFLTPLVLLFALVLPGNPLENIKRYYSVILSIMLGTAERMRALKTKRARQQREPGEDDALL
jgi:hypothetical protein